MERRRRGLGHRPWYLRVGPDILRRPEVGTSRKFWEIELAGKKFTTRWGRLGTEGQSQTKSWSSPAAAQKEYDKLLAEKVKKGYREVGGNARAALPNPGAASAKAKRNPALESAILAAPEETGRYLVYADWLQEQGDPRGELVAVQHGLGKNPKDKPLKRREAELFEAHRGALLGPLADYERTLDGQDRPAFEWRLGFIRSARFAWDHYANEARGGVDLGKAVRALLDHPSGFVLRELTIGLNRADPDQESSTSRWGR